VKTSADEREAFMQWVMQQTSPAGGNSTAVGEGGVPADQSGQTAQQTAPW